jgi:glycosyltransferase involved in cell wall biosynthesis
MIFKNGKEMREYVVIIPTFNNGSTLKEVLTGVMDVCGNVIVVNDGSSDNTFDLLNQFDGIEVITHNKNRGKGAALNSGFRKAYDLGYKYAITIDSDGQHYPQEINLLCDSSRKEPDTLCIGARDFKSDNMPGKNSFANRFSNFWFKLETGITLEDTQSGFRLYPLERLKGIRTLSGRYEFELEIIVRAAWRNVAVRNIPVSVYYPPKEIRISHFKPFKDFTRISILNTVLVFIALLWWWPLKFIKWFSRENIRNFIKKHITESKESNLHIAKSVGLGLFFGISPLWGYQMIAAVAAAHLLKLNKVIVLVASNISIPPMIPFILYGSFAAGAFILGEPISFIPSQLNLNSISDSLVQYLTGSIAFAAVAGITGMIVSYILLTVFRKVKV